MDCTAGINLLHPMPAAYLFTGTDKLATECLMSYFVRRLHHLVWGKYSLVVPILLFLEDGVVKEIWFADSLEFYQDSLPPLRSLLNVFKGPSHSVEQSHYLCICGSPNLCYHEKSPWCFFKLLPTHILTKEDQSQDSIKSTLCFCEPCCNKMHQH